LPRKEFDILQLLYSEPDRVFTREEIFRAIWGCEVVVGDRTLDVHIRRLRRKLGDDVIVTSKGVGFKLLL
jgi:two-component system alkaline phosphatase synthesis response regulator PhoP